MSYDINQVLSSPKLDLNQIFVKLVGKGGPYAGKQRELAKLVGIDATQISRLKGGGMPELKDHWRFSLRVLFLCMDLEMITEHDLLGLKGHGHHEDSNHSKTGKTSAHTR